MRISAPRAVLSARTVGTREAGSSTPWRMASSVLVKCKRPHTEQAALMTTRATAIAVRQPAETSVRNCATARPAAEKASAVRIQARKVRSLARLNR